MNTSWPTIEPNLPGSMTPPFASIDTDKLRELAKLITDVDELVQAIANALSRNEPWQRQLLAHLVRADTCMQILRMTVAMNRCKTETHDAANRLHAVLIAADASLRGARADASTKAAVQVAAGLSRRLAVALAG